MGEDRHCKTSLEFFLQPGMFGLDIGANQGEYTELFVKHIGPVGQVVALEPDDRSVAWLRRVFDGKPVEIVQAVAGAAPGEGVEFWLDPHKPSVNSLRRANLGDPDKAVPARVRMTTVDDLVARHLGGRVDAIKVDAQGAEAQILRGASRTLALPSLRWLQLELWPTGLEAFGDAVEDLKGLLEPHGFVPEDRSWQKVLMDAAEFRFWRTGFQNVVFRRGEG
jgi:FkbM family methyltransferase